MENFKKEISNYTNKQLDLLLKNKTRSRNVAEANLSSGEVTIRQEENFSRLYSEVQVIEEMIASRKGDVEYTGPNLSEIINWLDKNSDYGKTEVEGELTNRWGDVCANLKLDGGVLTIEAKHFMFTLIIRAVNEGNFPILIQTVEAW